MWVHHAPLDSSLLWHLHAWQLSWDGNGVWDPPGTSAGSIVNFQFPSVPDVRWLQFKFRSTSAKTGVSTWESDDVVRQIVDPNAAELWTFESSARILTHDPVPPGVLFSAGDVLTIHAITNSRFAGGQIYAWNPYDPTQPTAFFPQTARDSAQGLSTFSIPLANWMARGFHFKLVARDPGGNPLWEPNASNRVWRPCDGASVWIKSGQCDVRSQELVLTPIDVEVLLPASVATPPALVLEDVAEELRLPIAAIQTQPYPGSPLFRVATYRPRIYPQAGYNLSVAPGNGETALITRPFPANPADLTQASRFMLGTGPWMAAFPAVSAADLQIGPQSQSSFASGVRAQVFLGNSAMPYQSVGAQQLADGSWSVALTLMRGTTTSVRLLPTAGNERQPYTWIDTSRYFTPNTSDTYFTTEGVFGITARGRTPFGEPPVARAALMQAAFGNAIVAAGVFGRDEMPHGATLVGDDVYFVIHAPHAVVATLVLVDDTTSAKATRSEIPMSLGRDTFYWWGAIPKARAPPGTRYRFILNDDSEVLDPAAREVLDTGTFDVSYQADPNDPTTSWSVVLDVAEVRARAHTPPWNTLGWQALLIYEMHVRRFTDGPPATAPFDLLIDELQPSNRLGSPGYLRSLPVTAFELLPVHEFNSAISWGYDPSFYFAVDGHYGGSAGLARFVSAAHQNGRAVLLDVVYNHSLGSSLMKIAPDVYRNGDYDGDRMNCGHPMVLEFLRQATLHLWHTFGIDGLRFDDTQTIVTKCQGGWEFLAAIRSALRAAVSAEGQPWPYCVAENSATSPWDISNPGFGVMDGQWGIDEVYRVRDASYDLWGTSDSADPLRREMNNPAYWGRPFFQAVRFGESHDMVSAQDAGNQRIAARPPFGLGLQLAKALGTLTLLSNGIPMLFMGQEVGETRPFAFDSSAPALNPQQYTQQPATAYNVRVLAWFRQLMGLRNDGAQGLQGDANYQSVAVGHRTLAFACGLDQSLFVVVTFGTANQQQNSSWLGLPAGRAYKEIFNSSWPDFQVESELQRSNGGYEARIRSGQILNLPFVGAVVLQRA
jgi:1,4-alpha-glucan branching enzyme